MFFSFYSIRTSNGQVQCNHSSSINIFSLRHYHAESYFYLFRIGINCIRLFCALVVYMRRIRVTAKHKQNAKRSTTSCYCSHLIHVTHMHLACSLHIVLLSIDGTHVLNINVTVRQCCSYHSVSLVPTNQLHGQTAEFDRIFF